METDTRAYEIGFMAENEKGIHEIVDRIKAHQGDITLEGPVEQVALAYTIKNQTQAQFGYLHFTMNPSQVTALSDELLRASGVVRFLLVTPPFIKPKPRPMAPERARSALRPAVVPGERPSSEPLSNQALEKKIEEILQES